MGPAWRNCMYGGENLHIGHIVRVFIPCVELLLECWKWMKKKSNVNAVPGAVLLCSIVTADDAAADAQFLRFELPHLSISSSIGSRRKMHAYVDPFWSAWVMELEAFWVEDGKESKPGNRTFWTDSTHQQCGQKNDDPATLLWNTRYLENPIDLTAKKRIWLEAHRNADPYYSIPNNASECPECVNGPFASSFFPWKFWCLIPHFFDWVLLMDELAKKGRKKTRWISFSHLEAKWAIAVLLKSQEMLCSEVLNEEERDWLAFFPNIKIQQR